MNTELKTQIFPTPDALSEAAAAFILEQANEAIEARGRFSLVLSGGSTCKAIICPFSKYTIYAIKCPGKIRTSFGEMSVA